MKITCWTSYSKAEKKYIDPSIERLSLLNKDKNFITPFELQKLADEQKISTDEAYEKWKKEYDKIPMFADEKKAEELQKIYEEMEITVIEHCRRKGIRFNSNWHQGGDFGVPIIDNKYAFLCTLREWGRIMAKCDGIEDSMGYIKYYLPNEELAQNHPNEILGEVCE